MPKHDPLPLRKPNLSPMARLTKYLWLRTNARNRRKPPEAGIVVPAVPPNGPLPKQGGAEAPLEFD
jgi:hypothetical protein